MTKPLVWICVAYGVAFSVACGSGGTSQTSNDAGLGNTADSATDSPIDAAVKGTADSAASDGAGGGTDSSSDGDSSGSTCPAGTVSCAPAGGQGAVCTDSCPAPCDSSQGLMMCCMDNGFGQCSCFCSDGCGSASCAPAGTPVGTHHCSSPADCACGEGCGTDGICIAMGYTCGADQDCQSVSAGCPNNGVGYTCKGSRCVPPGWTCTNDADCGPGHKCSAGTCQ
jgi:hypothetical protein